MGPRRQRTPRLEHRQTQGMPLRQICERTFDDPPWLPVSSIALSKGQRESGAPGFDQADVGVVTLRLQACSQACGWLLGWPGKLSTHAIGVQLKHAQFR